MLNASPITEIRTAAVIGGGDEGCSPARARAPSPSSGPACRAALTSRRCKRCSTIRSSGSGAGTRPRRGARARDALARGRVDRGGARGRRRRVHRDRRLASRSSSSTGSPPGRTSTPSARPSRQSRELSSRRVAAATLFVDRRESTLNEAGDYLYAVDEQRHSARITSRPSSASVLVGTAPGTARRRRADAVQVDRHRRRGSRGCASCASHERVSAGSAPRSTSDPARRHPGSPRADRRRRDPDAARAAADARIAGRDLAQARVPAADRLVQDPRRCQRDPQRRPGDDRRRRPHDERGQHGAGRRLDRPRGAACPRRSSCPDHAPQTKLDAIERLGGTVIKVPFERWWQAMEEGAYPGVEGLLRPPRHGRRT